MLIYVFSKKMLFARPYQEENAWCAIPRALYKRKENRQGVTGCKFYQTRKVKTARVEHLKYIDASLCVWGLQKSYKQKSENTVFEK